MEKQNLSAKIIRPTLITIFCIVMFLGVLGYSMIFFGSLLYFASSEPELMNQRFFGEDLVLLILLITAFIGSVGYWKMQKYGVYSFIALLAFIVSLLVYDSMNSGLGMGGGIIIVLFVPLFAITVGYINFKKMT